NLANSIYERAKAAEVEREAAFQKAKNKKAKKKYAPTAKYIDHVIRQLENSLEHYQESLAFNGTNKDAAKKNMDKVAALVETLRDIRKGKDKEEQQAQGKGEGEEGEGEGQEGEGDGEGQSKGKGKGKGKGKAKGQGQGSGDEEGEGDGDSEGEGDGKGENEGKGKGDKDGDGKGGDDKSKDGDGAGANDKSNKEFDGKLKANGDGGNHDGEGDKDGKNGEGEKPGSSGEVARKQALQKLQNLSGELPPRARSGSVQERRPAKDW
ncbi:MAG TPA: hypothetical protein VHM91_04420, partial [Verrucomicrobiales bacterium]|nr:hypothetical protein [Verrucomicrobiales bacterium]